MEVMEDREVWRLILSCCPGNPHGKAGNEERDFFKKKTAFLTSTLIKLILPGFFAHYAFCIKEGAKMPV